MTERLNRTEPTPVFRPGEFHGLQPTRLLHPWDFPGKSTGFSVIRVSVYLPSDALLQHLPSYLGNSYLRRGVSLHGCSSKAQPLLLTLDEGCLLTAAPPDLERGVAPLGPPAPTQPQLLGRGVAPPLGDS